MARHPSARAPRATPPLPRDLPLDQLEDEIAERLYAGELDRTETEASPAVIAWAESVHEALDQLPAFQRLAAECRGDAAAAAAAVDEIMEELRPHLEKLERPPAEIRERIRRPAGLACQAASKAVQELREALSGLSGVAFRVRAPGTAEVENRSAENAPARALGAMLRKDSRLREIALLAGRMKRIAAGKRRDRVRHGADEITDVEQGDSLARALPSELARLRHPRRRLDFLRSLLERQVLQYQLVGTETLGRGPLVLLLDKSGSMEGVKDVWATAFSLALLEHAAAERRPFAVVHFNGRVSFEAVVRPGRGPPPRGSVRGVRRGHRHRPRPGAGPGARGRPEASAAGRRRPRHGRRERPHVGGGAPGAALAPATSASSDSGLRCRGRLLRPGAMRSAPSRGSTPSRSRSRRRSSEAREDHFARSSREVTLPAAPRHLKPETRRRPTAPPPRGSVSRSAPNCAPGLPQVPLRRSTATPRRPCPGEGGAVPPHRETSPC